MNFQMGRRRRWRMKFARLEKHLMAREFKRRESVLITMSPAIDTRALSSYFCQSKVSTVAFRAVSVSSQNVWTDKSSTYLMRVGRGRPQICDDRLGRVDVGHS